MFASAVGNGMGLDWENASAVSVPNWIPAGKMVEMVLGASGFFSRPRMAAVNAGSAGEEKVTRVKASATMRSPYGSWVTAIGLSAGIARSWAGFKTNKS